MNTTELAARWGEIITTEEQARAFVKDCLAVLGDAFHPDDPFDEYVEGDTGSAVFTEAEAERLELRIGEAFELLDNIYEVTIDIAEAL